jgi:hypothetical protein
MVQPFDKEAASKRLHWANKQVKDSQQRVEALRALLTKFEREGHDIKRGEMLLRVFEETLALQVSVRDRMAQELNKGK